MGYVQREVAQTGVPWRLRTDVGNGGGRGMGGGGNVGGEGFQSMVVENVHGPRVYGSQECVAGPPYIPPRSPERGFGGTGVRREFF